MVSTLLGLVGVEDSKAYRKYVGSLHTERTKEAYIKEITKFMLYVKVKNYDDLVKLEGVQDKIVDYLILLNEQKYSWSSRNLSKSAILKFYTQNNVVLNAKLISSYLGPHSYLNVDAPYSREEIERMLRFAGNIRNVAILLFAVSTGVRIQAFTGLKVGHLKRVDNMYRVDIYSDSESSYFGFLTPEATSALDDYLSLRRRQGENINSNSPLFRTEFDLTKPNSNIRPMRYSSVKSELRKIRFRSNVAQKQGKSKRGVKFESSTRVSMAFRKFFINNLLESGVNPEVREWLAGHSLPSPISNYMKQKYHEDRNLKEFMKAVDFLTISNEQRNEQLLKKQTDDIQVQLAQEKLRREQAEKELREMKIQLQKQGEDVKDLKEYLLPKDLIRKIKDAKKRGNPLG